MRRIIHDVVATGASGAQMVCHGLLFVREERSANTGDDINPLEQLERLGFSMAQASQALMECQGNFVKAKQLLASEREHNNAAVTTKKSAAQGKKKKHKGKNKNNHGGDDDKDATQST